MKAKRTLIALNVLLVAVLTCNLPTSQNLVQQSGPTSPATPQEDVALKATDTPTFTETPSLTPTVTLTSTPKDPEVIVTAATNCRTGPGVVYDLLYTMQPGQVAKLIGKYTPMNYWIINMPSGGICWLWGQYAIVSGNVAGLPEYPQPPTPTPGLPANPSGLKVGFECTLNGPLLRYDVHADLSWQDNATNEEGYYVYRNDELLATLGTDETSYSDDTIMGTAIVIGPKPQITYSVQAFNATGKSKKISKSISCFD